LSDRGTAAIDLFPRALGFAHSCSRTASRFRCWSFKLNSATAAASAERSSGGLDRAEVVRALAKLLELNIARAGTALKAADKVDDEDLIDAE
jgi:hypothetical protein